jgi:hypothetical protein
MVGWWPLNAEPCPRAGLGLWRTPPQASLLSLLVASRRLVIGGQSLSLGVCQCVARSAGPKARRVRSSALRAEVRCPVAVRNAARKTGSSAFCEDCGSAPAVNATPATTRSPQAASTAPEIRVTPEQPEASTTAEAERKTVTALFADWSYPVSVDRDSVGLAVKLCVC